MRKNIAGYIAIIAAFAGFPSLAHAQDYPTKPLQIYQGFPAGSGLDIVTRYYAGHLQRMTGQTAVVQNRLGANGTIAMGAMARSAPDGHTMLFGPGASAAHVVIKSLGFDPLKDVIPVASVVAFPFLLVVSPNHSKATTVAEFIEELKRKNTISYGAPNSLGYVGGAMITQAHGLKGVPVQYKVNADAVRDLIAGDLDFIVNEANSSFAMVREGKLRGLAVTLGRRSRNAPDLPTMIELGYKDINFHGWMGVYLPAGTPPAIVAKLEAWIVEIGRSEETAAFYKKIGGDVFALNQAEFRQWELDEFAAWKVRAKIANLEAN